MGAKSRLYKRLIRHHSASPRHHPTRWVQSSRHDPQYPITPHILRPPFWRTTPPKFGHEGGLGKEGSSHGEAPALQFGLLSGALSHTAPQGCQQSPPSSLSTVGARVARYRHGKLGNTNGVKTHLLAGFWTTGSFGTIWHCPDSNQPDGPKVQDMLPKIQKSPNPKLRCSRARPHQSRGPEGQKKKTVFFPRQRPWASPAGPIRGARGRTAGMCPQARYIKALSAQVPRGSSTGRLKSFEASCKVGQVGRGNSPKTPPRRPRRPVPVSPTTWLHPIDPKVP